MVCWLAVMAPIAHKLSGPACGVHRAGWALEICFYSPCPLTPWAVPSRLPLSIGTKQTAGKDALPLQQLMAEMNNSTRCYYNGRCGNMSLSFWLVPWKILVLGIPAFSLARTCNNLPQDIKIVQMQGLVCSSKILSRMFLYKTLNIRRLADVS